MEYQGYWQCFTTCVFTKTEDDKKSHPQYTELALFMRCSWFHQIDFVTLSLALRLKPLFREDQWTFIRNLCLCAKFFTCTVSACKQSISHRASHPLSPTPPPVEEQQLSGRGIFQKEIGSVFNSIAQGWQSSWPVKSILGIQGAWSLFLMTGQKIALDIMRVTERRPNF